MCNCINEVGEAIKKKFGNFEFINLEVTLDLKSGESRTALPLLKYKYYPKRKDGSVSKKPLTGFIGYAYCPFCGEEYHEKKKGKRNATTN